MYNKMTVLLASVAVLFAAGLVQAEEPASVAPAATEASAPAPAPAPAPIVGEVARAVITTAVVDREPTDDLQVVPSTNNPVIFFTELRNMEGQTITHLWKHNGEVMAEVKFNVGGPRWRIWSSKNMVDGWTGDWVVDVIDPMGAVLKSTSFTYEAAVAEAPAEAPAEAADSAEMTGDMGAGEEEKAPESTQAQ